MHVRREWWLAALAPTLVVAGLLALHSVAAVFAVYHVGLCLVTPWVVSRREGRGWREHLRAVGLARRGLRPGLLLGLGFAAAPVLAWLWWPALFPPADRLAAVLANWGVAAGRVPAMLAVLVVLNGPAEELFWRGWLQARLPAGRVSLGLQCLLFTTYHGVTVGALAPTVLATVTMLVGILAAALFWAWSRRRWDSVWPALIAHGGATLGYAAVCRAILG